MVHSVANWKEYKKMLILKKYLMKNDKLKHLNVQEHIQYCAPDSYSLSEMDREYFNIFKTEDGLSQFFKTKRYPQ